MKQLSKHLSLLFAAVLICVVVAGQQNPGFIEPKSKVLNIQNERGKIVYHLNIVQPELAIEQLIAAFKEKHNILSCSLEGNRVTVITTPDVELRHIADVVKTAGFKATYMAIKEQVRESQYAPVVRREVK